MTVFYSFFYCLFFLSIISKSTSLAFNRELCQSPTLDPLEGCPNGTLIVGSNSTFKTVQSAVLSLPHDTSAQIILILPGNYTEQVNVTRPGPLYLLGQSSHPQNNTRNLVQVIWHNATGTSSTGSYDNAYTSTLTIAPTLNSSLTGSGTTGNAVPPDTPFGNTDFRAYNIDFVNDYLPYSAGPSLALSVSYANAGFYSCGFYSYQDTVRKSLIITKRKDYPIASIPTHPPVTNPPWAHLRQSLSGADVGEAAHMKSKPRKTPSTNTTTPQIYIGKLASTYISTSTIAGETDFLYGFGTLWIQDSELQLRGCGGGITAWKGTNTTFANHYGAYVHGSVVAAANASIAATMTGRCALGRPWNAAHRSIFANTWLDASIKASGYIEWSSTDPRIGISE